jgi:hypothetical protein
VAEDLNKLKTSRIGQQRLLIIAGTGRDSGKSTLAELLIARFAERSITGVKITPHDHPDMPGLTLVAEGERFKVFEERCLSSDKDSSRMLRAGAAKVFLIVSASSSALDAWLSLQPYLPTDVPVVCESPALRRYVDPDMFIIMTHGQRGDYGSKDINDLIPLADLLMTIDDLQSGKADVIDLNQDNRWCLKQ